MMVSHDRPLKQTIGVDRSRAIDAGKIEIRGLEQELARNRKEEEAVKDALLEVSTCVIFATVQLFITISVHSPHFISVH